MHASVPLVLRIVAVTHTFKRGVNLFTVRVPPSPVHRKQRIGPRRNAETGVDYDDAFFGRPRFFPGSDAGNIVCGKAWAAGDADALSPAASEGRSRNTFV